MAVGKINSRNAVQAYNEADQDSDGAIDYSEFRSLTQTTTGGRK